MHTRRRFLQCAALAATAAAAPLGWAKLPRLASADLVAAWRRIERDSGGRLGLALHDAGGRRLAGQRDDERFPMCSTFKFLLAGAVLARVDAGRLSLERRVPIAASDLLGNSPTTREHVGPTGMSVAGLTEATLIWSDNAAANLLFPLVDGPAGLTAFLRAHGDTVTRSDRNEPELNHFTPGDDRDTTTPAAMAANLRRLLLGDALSATSRQQLIQWLRDNRTGNARLRAGLPNGWKAGDKTGSNGEDITNDIAILWPPGGRAPVLLTAYLQGARVDQDAQNAALRDAAAAVAAVLG
ncbi:MAG TPA: class A beta-lactamase [Stenotrophomonas sp.]